MSGQEKQEQTYLTVTMSWFDLVIQTTKCNETSIIKESKLFRWSFFILSWKILWCFKLNFHKILFTTDFWLWNFQALMLTVVHFNLIWGIYILLFYFMLLLPRCSHFYSPTIKIITKHNTMSKFKPVLCSIFSFLVGAASSKLDLNPLFERRLGVAASDLRRFSFSECFPVWFCLRLLNLPIFTQALWKSTLGGLLSAVIRTAETRGDPS